MLYEVITDPPGIASGRRIEERPAQKIDTVAHTVTKTLFAGELKEHRMRDHEARGVV